MGLFAQRNYNIETLTVAPTEDATLSRVTLSTEGSDDKIEQITKHLNRLVDVVKVLDPARSGLRRAGADVRQDQRRGG